MYQKSVVTYNDIGFEEKRVRDVIQLQKNYNNFKETLIQECIADLAEIFKVE